MSARRLKGSRNATAISTASCSSPCRQWATRALPARSSICARTPPTAPWASSSTSARRTSASPICSISSASCRRRTASGCPTGLHAHAGASRRAGRDRPRLRAAQRRLFQAESTLPIDESVCLTATIDILRRIADGNGPDNAMLALGYAGWAPGQLESEIQANGWLHCPADPELIFDPEIDRKYSQALDKIGIDPVAPRQRCRPRLARAHALGR